MKYKEENLACIKRIYTKKIPFQNIFAVWTVLISLLEYILVKR